MEVKIWHDDKMTQLEVKIWHDDTMTQVKVKIWHDDTDCPVCLSLPAQYFVFSVCVSMCVRSCPCLHVHICVCVYVHCTSAAYMSVFQPKRPTYSQQMYFQILVKKQHSQWLFFTTVLFFQGTVQCNVHLQLNMTLSLHLSQIGQILSICQGILTIWEICDKNF